MKARNKMLKLMVLPQAKATGMYVKQVGFPWPLLESALQIPNVSLLYIYIY